jgi:hypothetical protein
MKFRIAPQAEVIITHIHTVPRMDILLYCIAGCARQSRNTLQSGTLCVQTDNGSQFVHFNKFVGHNLLLLKTKTKQIFAVIHINKQLFSKSSKRGQFGAFSRGQFKPF